MAEEKNAAEQKRYEAWLRRRAADMGVVLRKSRARDDCRMDYGCYRIESKDGIPMVGTYPYPYSLNLDGVAEALEQLEEAPPDMGRDAAGNIIHGRAGAADPDWGKIK